MKYVKFLFLTFVYSTALLHTATYEDRDKFKDIDHQEMGS